MNYKLFILFSITFCIVLPNFGQDAKKTKSNSQTILIGYQYLTSTDEYSPLKFTRTYSGADGVYVTTYFLYDPNTGHHAITITATHHQENKTVTVKVEDAGGGIFSDINSEETRYETASLEPFGFRGSVGSLGGKRVPNQLKVKFASNKFENVKVIDVAGSHENGEFEFFVLDEK